MEDRDMQALGADHGQTGIGITEHKHCIGLYLCHEFITLGNDVPHCLAQIVSDCI